MGATWRNPRVLGILALVFLAGAGAGAVTMRLGLAMRATTRPSLVFKYNGADLSLDRLTRELQLSPAQQSQMVTILDDFGKYYQDLQIQMEDVRANGKSRILMILNHEQKQRFEKMLSEMQARQGR